MKLSNADLKEYLCARFRLTEEAKMARDEDVNSNKNNPLKKRLNLIVEESIRKITERVKRDCLEGVPIKSGSQYYRLFYTKYLNSKYNLKLPVTEFNDLYVEDGSAFDSIISSISIGVVYGIICYEGKKKIKSYLEDIDLEDMIADDILKTYENILNYSEEGSNAKEELVNYWVKPCHSSKYENELDDWAASYKESKSDKLGEDINKLLEENNNTD